ncbi:MAG: helix-turn-helix transcriptional regulator [Candidatus Peregrinibacteria bacterium]
MKKNLKKRKLSLPEDPNIQYLEDLWEDPEFQGYYKEASQVVDVAIMIAEMRDAKKLTQKELAKRLNTNQSVISRIEKGVENITLKRLFDLVKALGFYIKLSWHPLISQRKR